MVETGPKPLAGPNTGRSSVFVTTVLLLIPASVLAGCIAQPSTDFTLRQGDLVQADIVLVNETLHLPPNTSASTTIQALCGTDVFANPSHGCPNARHAYTLTPDTPPTSVPGYEDPYPLPPHVIDALTGLSEGEHTIERGLLAFGPHDPDLVQTHPRNGTLPRIVETSSPYGQAWNLTPLDDGRYRIEPNETTQGRLLEAPEWCNERFCLFESRVTGWNATHIEVRHQASPGDQAHIQALNTWLTVTDANAASFTIDGNNPHAGERFDLYARIDQARGPPEGERRAPGFTLATLNGSTLSLDAYLGQPILLEFFATWCPSCIKNTEHLNQLQTRFGDQIQLISIDVDPWERPGTIRTFAHTHNVTWPILIDENGTVSQAYHVGSLSTEVLISPNGAIVHTETGVADHDRVVQEIQTLLNATQAPPEGETR